MKPSDSLNDIREYIDDLRLKADKRIVQGDTSRSLYRKFHALLIWDLLVDRDEFCAPVRLFMREAAADFSTGYFLTLVGAYKPARLSIRSGIENAIRVCIESASVDATAVSSIPQLFQAFRESFPGQDGLDRSSAIYDIYSELCLTVHSASIDYMSLRVPFERMFEINEIESNINVRLLSNSFKYVNEALFIALHQELSLIDYKNADYVRDSIQASVKAEAARSKAS